MLTEGGTDTTEADRLTQRRTPDRRASIVAAAVVAITLLPVLAVVVTRTGRHYVPAGDMGLIDLRVRDVFSLHPPLVGPYSRYGWSHPGPLLFYLLAIPSLLAGRQAWGTEVGAALLQGIAICWLAWLAWRRGRLPLLAAAMATVSLVYASTGTWVVLEPWNPHVAIPWFLLFAFQGWLVATGDHRAMVGAAVSGSFLIQTHVGYAPLVLVIVGVAATYVVRDVRAKRCANSNLRALGVKSVVILIVLWLPPLIETAQNLPGNLARTAYYFVRSKPEPVIGLGAGVQLLAAEFRWVPSWLGGSDFFDPLTHRALGGSLLLLVVPAVLLATTYVLGRRLGLEPLKRYAVLVGCLTAVTPFVLGNVTGVPYPYLFYWRPAIAVLIVVGVVIALGALLRQSKPSIIQPVAVVLVISALFAGSGRLGYDVVTHHGPISPYEQSTAELATQLERVGTPPRGVILRIDTSSLIALQRGIFDEAVRRGMRVYADTPLAFEFGDNHTAPATAVDEVWWVTESGAVTNYFSSLPSARVIAYSTPLSPSDEAEASQLEAQLLDELRAAGRLDRAPELDSDLVAFTLADVPGIDAEALNRMGALNSKVARAGGCRCGVVAFAPDAAPAAVPW